MALDDFAAEMDRLWLQVKPLYDALHAFAFTRNGLERAYGARGAAPDGRIPAHLLGNIWSRDGLEAGHLYVVRDPLRRDRLQHLYLSVGMRRPKMLDVS
jgi:peptidyl-dipeptidase A